MPSQQKGGSFGKKVMQITGYILLIGLAWALLRQFNMDPFEVVGWALGDVVNLINHISDFFMGTKVFQEGTKAPGIISLFN